MRCEPPEYEGQMLLTEDSSALLPPRRLPSNSRASTTLEREFDGRLMRTQAYPDPIDTRRRDA